MIKLEINVSGDHALPKYIDRAQRVVTSLAELEGLIPNHKETDFKRSLWKNFKIPIWEAQGRKCAFCEKQIPAQESHLEHFRPKAEVKDLSNVTITRQCYWWLAYEHNNYLVTCPTCNNQKGNKFPLSDETKRVTDKNQQLTLDGRLSEEEPRILNPRYETNIEESFRYLEDSDTGQNLVYILGINERSDNTVDAIDLNRKNVNKNVYRDMLPIKRGNKLHEFLKEFQSYAESEKSLREAISVQSKNPDAQLVKYINFCERKLNKFRENINKGFLSSESEFAGLCRWWLNNRLALDVNFFTT